MEGGRRREMSWILLSCLLEGLLRMRKAFGVEVACGILWLGKECMKASPQCRVFQSLRCQPKLQIGAALRESFYDQRTFSNCSYFIAELSLGRSFRRPNRVSEFLTGGIGLV